MHGLDELRERGKMTWVERESGWAAAPQDVVDALVGAGFEECKRATTTSRRDLRPAGGMWQGLNQRTGSVASTIWVDRPSPAHIIVFVTIDGEPVRAGAAPDLDPDPYRDSGGEG